jgi:hypothetical protein
MQSCVHHRVTDGLSVQPKSILLPGLLRVQLVHVICQSHSFDVATRVAVLLMPGSTVLMPRSTDSVRLD